MSTRASALFRHARSGNACRPRPHMRISPGGDAEDAVADACIPAFCGMRRQPRPCRVFPVGRQDSDFCDDAEFFIRPRRRLPAAQPQRRHENTSIVSDSFLPRGDDRIRSAFDIPEAAKRAVNFQLHSGFYALSGRRRHPVFSRFPCVSSVETKTAGRMPGGIIHHATSGRSPANNR